MRLHLIHKSAWEALISDSVESLSTDVECFFIVKFFDFNSLNFCIFSHIDLIHILLDLYLTFQIVVLEKALEESLGLQGDPTSPS